MLDAEFRRRLRAERIRCGLTQNDVAYAAGLHQVTICTIERGRFRTLHAATMAALLEVFPGLMDRRASDA